jgi:hypothetical protein
MPKSNIKPKYSKIVFIFDHGLGYLQKKIQKITWNNLLLANMFIHPKDGESEYNEQVRLDGFNKVFLFLNFSPVLKKKTH